MVHYVCSLEGHVDEVTQQWIFDRYVPVWREAEMPFYSIDVVPPYYKVLEADFDEPCSAVAWNANVGLYLKPESERGYELTQISWYPALRSYLQGKDKVLAELLATITAQYPIRPSKLCFEAIKTALDAATQP